MHNFQNLLLFSVSSLKDKKLIKKQTYMKTEAQNSKIEYVNISAKCHQHQSS